MCITRKDEIVQRTLIDWYQNHRVVLPWRKTTNPYHILVSELMLQRTTRYQVFKVYDKFLQKYPSAEKLAVANLDEIKNLLAPLGLTRRAVRFKQLGEILVEEFSGKIPRSKVELLRLPGIGEYIASVIMCFAYGERTAIIDVNVVRILRRIYLIKQVTANPSSDPRIKELANKILPKKNWISYNFAILDFGSDICKARWMRCEVCPLKTFCCWDKIRSEMELSKLMFKKILGF